MSVDYGDISVFERFNSTVTTTTTAATGVSTTAAGTTLAPSTQPTTTGHASVITSFNALVILLISVFSLNFY